MRPSRRPLNGVLSGSEAPTFAVHDHWLVGRGPLRDVVRHRPSPNHDGAIRPSILVFHYTACDGTEARAEFLRATGPRRVSAHLLVEADGSVLQFVAFDQRAWHAGASRWAGLEDLNSHSIGVELVNYGPLRTGADGTYQPVNGGPAIDSGEVVEARHRMPHWIWSHWHTFTAQQIATCEALVDRLVPAYRLIDVLGHDDIAPNRKADPGPAFPLQALRARVWSGKGP